MLRIIFTAKSTTMTFKVSVQIMPLKGLLDPQGKAVNASLNKIGLSDIEDVRIGKQINLTIEASNEEEARTKAEEACEKILYNPVMEEYEISLLAS